MEYSCRLSNCTKIREIYIRLWGVMGRGCLAAAYSYYSNVSTGL